MCQDLKLRWLLRFYTVTELCQDCRESCFRQSRFNKSSVTAMKIPKNAIFVDVVALYLCGRIHNHLLVPVFRWSLESVGFQTMPMAVDNSQDVKRTHWFLESSIFLCVNGNFLLQIIKRQYYHQVGTSCLFPEFTDFLSYTFSYWV